MLRARLLVDEHPFFQNAAEAVRFALSFAGRPPRPALSRMLDWMRSRHAFAVMDPAVQAAMILNIVGKNGRFAMAVMTASVGPARYCGETENLEWHRAIDIIAEEAFAKGISRSSYLLRVACVLKVFGGKLSRKEIAEDLGISKDVVTMHFKAIHQWLRGGKSRQNESAPAGVEHKVWCEAEKALRTAWPIR